MKRKLISKHVVLPSNAKLITFLADNAENSQPIFDQISNYSENTAHFSKPIVYLLVLYYVHMYILCSLVACSAEHNKETFCHQLALPSYLQVIQKFVVLGG